jgi:O-antigen ligase
MCGASLFVSCGKLPCPRRAARARLTIQSEARFMKAIVRLPSLMLLAFLLVLFSFSAIEVWHAAYGWHDQQRICQLLLIFFAAPLLLFLPQPALPRAALVVLVGIFVWGLASSRLSAWPDWAMKEWARYAGLMLMALLLGGLARAPRVSNFVLWVMAFVGFIHAFQFLVFYLAAFISGIRVLHADFLFGGFANRRFFAQFQVMLMPVLALLTVLCWQRRDSKLAGLLLLVLAIQWCMAFMLGGRGLWLGLLISHAAVVLINRRLWRLVALQAVAALLGAVVFLVLFKLIPYWLGITSVVYDELRTDLSGREVIWQAAWNMALANPWFGVGPMHFSATYNPIAAHPHQVILQWLAEWGFVATAMTLMVGLWGLVHGAVCLRRPTAGALDAGLALAILGALVLAQVDGVFVMPYTETWLALLIGLALARWSKSAQGGRAQRFVLAILAIAVVLVFWSVLVKEVPALPQNEKAYLQKNIVGWVPRFWDQGWIPMAAE